MSAFIDYIIRHSYFKEVNSTYNLAKERHTEAFSLWLQEQTETIGDDYESKKYIHAHIQEIKRLDNCIKIVRNAIRISKKSVEWFFHDRGADTIPTLRSKDYKLIADNISVIRQYESYIREYSNLLNVNKEAVDRMIGQNLSTHSFEQIRLIATSKRELVRISDVIKKAHSCEKKFPHAWDLYSHGRAFVDISIDDLESIVEDDFCIKEQFVILYNKQKKLFDVIMGEENHDVSCFSEEVINKENDCMFFQMTQSLNVHPYEGKVQIDGKELRRAILDSKRYGTDTNFSDDFSIYQFYKLRQEADKLDLRFDTIIARTKDNYDAIKAFNNEQLGKSVVYIEDYIPASTVGTPLYDYIETYKEQKEKRDSARRIASCYPLGFACHFDSNLDFESCDFSLIMMILNSEQRIIASEREELEKKKKREEEERKRREEAEIRERVCTLKNCVSEWPALYGGLHYTNLVNYFPTSCIFEATQSEWNDRWLVWNFKNTPGKTSASAHNNALNTVIPRMKSILTSTFGIQLLKDLTFVCIPASSAIKTELRYAEFSKRICEETGMINAYDHITVVSSTSEKKFGGSGICTESLAFDDCYFKGRYILLFDDVITKGESMLRFKRKMEELGANVIAGFSVGRTKHERPNDFEI